MRNQSRAVPRKLAGQAMPTGRQAMPTGRQAKFERDKKRSEFEERVIEISRVSRVVKGGRRIRFRILVVIGDQKGRVGYGVAKANEIAVGVKKAVNHAQKHLISVPIVNDTIPYQVTQEHGSAKIMLKPASLGTSIVAGGVVRVVAELAGIKNLVAKVIGTANKINNVKAIFVALSSFDPEKVERIKKRILKINKTVTSEPVETKEVISTLVTGRAGGRPRKLAGQAKTEKAKAPKNTAEVPTESVGKKEEKK